MYPHRLAVTNPGFESGTAPGTGWTTVNGMPGFGTANPPPDLRGGSRYLYLSTTGGAGSYRVRQDVAIPAECQTDVDAGSLSATLRFLWANYAAGNDQGFVELTFLDAGNAVISTAASGAFPDSPQAWTARAFTAAVPAGTRTLRLILGGTWATGTAVDSYFDAIEAELALTAAPAGDVTQVYAEDLFVTDSAGRVSQMFAEAILAADSPARISQTYGETLIAPQSPARATQVYAELIRSITDRPASAEAGTIVCIIAG